MHRLLFIHTSISSHSQCHCISCGGPAVNEVCHQVRTSYPFYGRYHQHGNCAELPTAGQATMLQLACMRQQKGGLSPNNMLACSLTPSKA
jgi:hypothetical protein